MFALILIIGLVLRLINLNQSFWLDEATQAQFSISSVREIWFGRAGDFHPPLYYLFTHFWSSFGVSEVWLRLPSVIFGVAAILAIYFFCKDIFNNKLLGLFAGLFLSLNPYAIYYSQEFRCYSLILLLGILSTHALLKKHPLYFALASLLMYTHYSSFFLLISHMAYVLLMDRKLFKFVLTHFFLSFLLYTPWLPQLFSQLKSGLKSEAILPGWHNLLSVPIIKSFPLILFKFTAGRINLYPTLIYGLYVIFVLSVVSLCVFFARKKRSLLFIWLFLPIVISLLFSLKLPQTQPFRLIYTLPPLIIIFSQAVLRFPRTFITFLVYISIIGNFLYFTRPRLQREQWRQASNFLNTQNSPVVVKFSGPFSPLVWYAPNLNVLPASSELPINPSNVATILAQLVSEDKLFVMDYLGDITDPNKLVETTVRDLGFIRRDTYNFEGVGFVHKYTKSI
jgi:uncharacterized membrane protein